VLDCYFDEYCGSNDRWAFIVGETAEFQIQFLSWEGNGSNGFFCLEEKFLLETSNFGFQSKFCSSIIIMTNNPMDCRDIFGLSIGCERDGAAMEKIC